MGADKLTWCLKQKRGIELTGLKPHLSESYIKEADDTLGNMLAISGKWKLIMGYYACYNSLYAILMKCGIRCEIHECSIALMGLLGFDNGMIDFLIRSKDNRIQAQYYLKKIEFEDEIGVKRFISKCKEILEELNSERINEIRSAIEKLKRG